MAKQHFYSRVPARMSLFNRMDGYDTFAHSQEISRSQIEGELSAVYDQKPTKEDAALIQKGCLPTVYTQFSGEDGTLIQSAVSYSDKDYTGERSSYMVHTLLLSQEERAACLENPETGALNPENFVTDLSDFDLTASDARPITDYPERQVKTAPAGNLQDLAAQYDTGMMKRLVYSLLGIACGKTKALYLGLPSPMETFSRDCLDFLNTAMQAFPYHMRPYLSFVTYVGDMTKFGGFKIRCIPETAPMIPGAKGVSLRMGAKDYNGIGDENIAANASVVDFFYSLFTQDAVRREFLLFCQSAVKANPALEKPSFKNLADLTFLFQALCGYYPEKQILPNDDAVYNFIAVYDKNRTALPDEYRIRAMKCLKRYPESQTAVPKNVFSKVASVYPTEPEASRRIVVGVVLDLIHTDAMRDKLFGFIKNNYDNEEPQTREAMMANLCRVYYGGFLQAQILEFFREKFPTEPESVRDLILERLMLTIRTPAVQEAVLGFVDEFYDQFSRSEKDKFYSTFYEMLPDGDQLSRAMANVVDRHVEEDRKPEVAEKLLHQVDLDDKRKEPKLCQALVTACGFTEATIAGKAFTSWSKRGVPERFALAVCAKPLDQRMETLREIWQAAPDMTEETADNLLSVLSENFKKGSRPDLYQVIRASDELGQLAADVPASRAFAEKLQTQTVQPMAVYLLPTAFDAKRNPDGIAQIVQLAAERKYLSESGEYQPVRLYTEGVTAIRAGDGKTAIARLAGIEGRPVRQGAAEQMKKTLAKEELSDVCRMIASVATEFLRTDELWLYNPAEAMRGDMMKRLDGTGDKEAAAQSVDEKALGILLKLAGDLTETDLPEERKATLTSETGEVGKYVTAFLRKYDKKGKKLYTDVLASLSLPAPFRGAAEKMGSGKSSGGFFQKLFGKK